MSERIIVPLTDEKVMLTGPAKIRTAYIDLAKSYNKITGKDYLYCHKCAQFYNKKDFWEDEQYMSGYYPVCKHCMVDIAMDFDIKTQKYCLNREGTIKALQMLDLPFFEDVYIDAVKFETSPSADKTFHNSWEYIMQRLRSNERYKGLKFCDSVIDDKTGKTAETVRPEIINIFGDGFETMDYIYLQHQYDDLKARTTVDTKSQEIYAVRICFNLLKLWEAERQGKDTRELDRSLNELMAAANLQPKQNVKNAANDTLTFGQMIEKWEVEKPIPEPDEEFKDVNGIGKLIRVFFSGHLAKALGLKNAYSEEYEEEMDKYTVRKLEAREDEMSDVYQNIFGAEESQ